MPQQLKRRSRILLGLPVAMFFLVWQSHVISTAFGDPLGLPLDIALWGIGTLLKIISICATPFLLAEVYASMAGSLRRTVVMSCMLAVSGAGVVGLAGATRERWAPQLSNDAIKYYSFGDERSHLGVSNHWEEWKTDWSNGTVVKCEIGVVLILALLTASIGYFFGHHRIQATVAGYFSAFLVLLAYNIMTGWHLSDYDEFHGDIFAFALLIDHCVFFVGIDPYTTFTSVAYVVFVIASLSGLFVNEHLLEGNNSLNKATPTLR